MQNTVRSTTKAVVVENEATEAKGHRRGDSQMEKGNIQRWNCGEIGHMARDCKKKITKSA